jgi:hypothetical protein
MRPNLPPADAISNLPAINAIKITGMLNPVYRVELTDVQKNMTLTPSQYR